MGVKITDLPSDSSIGGTEIMVGVDGTTTKRFTTAAMAAYAVDVLLAAASATPTTGDNLVGERSGTEKLLDLDDVAAYALASGWLVATEADPALSGDMVLVERSGTIYQVDVDTLVEYALTGIQADVLDISGFSSATLAGTDQYLVVQGSTAKKTTLTAIETKLWADLVTHVSGLSAVTTATETDKIHVIQGGTEKYVTPAVLSTYIASDIATDVLDAAFGSSEVDPAVSGDMLLLSRSDVLKTVDVDTIVDYVDATIAATSAATPLVTGDKLVLYRSGTRKLGTVDDVSDFVLADAWSADAVTSLVAGDEILIGRSGVPKNITWENLTAGVRSTLLDLTGLSSATLDATDVFLVGESTAPKTATLLALETKLWADYATYVSGLTAVTAVLDGDLFWTSQGGTAKKVTPVELAAYIQAEISSDLLDGAWDADAVASAASGDLLLLSRSDVRKTIDIDDIATYVGTAILDSAAISPLLTGDEFFMSRSGVAKTGTIDDLLTFTLAGMWGSTTVTSLVAGDLVVLGRSGATKTITASNLTAGIRADALNISGLSTATLGSTDQLLVCQSTTPKKTTLSALETTLWTDFATYAAALTAVTTVADADVLYVRQSGVPKSLTIDQVVSYVSSEVGTDILDAAWDADSVSSALSGDILLLARSDVRKTIDIDDAGEYINSLLLASAAVTPLATGDVLLMSRSGEAKTGTIDDLSDFVLADAWSATVVTSLVAGDLVLLGRSGVPQVITTANLATGIQADVLNISGLSSATLAGSDQILVVQSTTAKKTTLTSLETQLWSDFATYAAALTAVTAVGDTDVFYSLQSGVPKKVTASQLATYMTAEVNADILDSAWDADAVASVTTGDVLLLARSDVRKTGTVDQLSDFVTSELASSAAVDPLLTGDSFLLFRSGVAKLGDIDDLATYVLPQMWDADTVTSALDGDMVLLGRSSVSKQITAANFVAYVLDGVQADVLDISGLSSATLGSGNEFLVCQSGTPKKVTLSTLETKLWTDFATYAAALTDGAAVVDADKFYMLHAGSPVYVTGTEIATYVGTQLWEASAATGGLTGDSLLMYRAGTGMMKITVDLISDFIVADLQTDVLDISGLDEATLATTDMFLVCQAGVAKQTTLEDLRADIHDAMSDYVSNLDTISSILDADYLYIITGGIPKKVSVLDLADKVASASSDARWATVEASKYTAAPPNNYQVAMSDTSDFAVGLPVRWMYNFAYYYGIVTAISTDASITIAGAPLPVGQSLTMLFVGRPEMVVQLDIQVAGVWDSSAADLLSPAGMYCKWQRGDACLVAFSATQGTADTGLLQGKVNVKVNTNTVSTADSNKGVQLSATAGTWTENTATAISSGYYAISRGHAIEVACTQTGTSGDAEDLNVSITFVLK